MALAPSFGGKPFTYMVNPGPLSGSNKLKLDMANDNRAKRPATSTGRTVNPLPKLRGNRCQAKQVQALLEKKHRMKIHQR